MTRGSLKCFVQFFVVLALFSAGISPACQFRSGESNLIEICTPFGVKQIAFSFDGRAPAPPPNEKHNKAAEQCAFCVSAQVNKVAVDTRVALDLALYDSARIFTVFDDYWRSQITQSFDARGPPQFS